MAADGSPLHVRTKKTLENVTSNQSTMLCTTNTEGGPLIRDQ